MTDCADKAFFNKPLYQMFAVLPPRYDLINRVITWGLDERWRREAAKNCLVQRPQRVLDLCCGTGDLLVNLARLADNSVELTGVDYNRLMLGVAAKKVKSLAVKRKILLICGGADDLPFSDGYFDCVGISFAFRNLVYKNPLAQRHLAEVLRVLGNGGRFVIVETSQPTAKLIRQLYHLYLRGFVAIMGYLLSGRRGAYRYLAESTTRFYNADEVKEMLLSVGFQKVSFRPFLFGAVGIHIAIK